MKYGNEKIPLEIKQLTAERKLVILWEGGESMEYSMEYLRVMCPCADCRGHMPSQKKLIDGMRNIEIAAIEPTGHYAVKIAFSDGHDSGLYAWDDLYELGKNQESHWQGYLDELSAKGKSRDICTLAGKACGSGSCGH